MCTGDAPTCGPAIQRALRRHGPPTRRLLVRARPGRRDLPQAHAVYGPCGGVREDLTLRDGRPPVPVRRRPASPRGPAGDAAPAPPGRRAAGRAPPARWCSPTSPSAPSTPATCGAVTAVLAGSCDALLVGEHQGRPDFPPSLMAPLSPRRRRRPVDHADLPRPQPGRARAGAGRAGRGRRGRGAVRDRRRPRARACAPTSPRSSTSTAPGWPRWPPRPGCRGRPEAPDAPPAAAPPGAAAREAARRGPAGVLNHVGSAARLAASRRRPARPG